MPWETKVPKFELDPELPLQVYLILIRPVTATAVAAPLSNLGEAGCVCYISYNRVEFSAFKKSSMPTSIIPNACIRIEQGI